MLLREFAGFRCVDILPALRVNMHNGLTRRARYIDKVCARRQFSQNGDRFGGIVADFLVINTFALAEATTLPLISITIRRPVSPGLHAFEVCR